MADSYDPVLKLSVHGHSVSLYLPDPEDHIQKRIRRRQGFYEPELLEDMRARVRAGDLCVDVGAHLGNHTVFLAEVCGARVLSFEPQPDIFGILRRNIELNALQDRVRVENVALDETPGRGAMNRTLPDNSGSATLRRQGDGPVRITTLDHEVGGERVSLIKVDVEGFELEVLKGAAQIIARDSPILYVEAADLQHRKSLETHLSTLGYVAAQVFPGTPVLLFIPCKTAEERLSVLISRLGAMQRDLVAGAAAPRASREAPEGALREVKAELTTLVSSVDHRMALLRTEQSERLDAIERAAASVASRLNQMSSAAREQSAQLLELWNLGAQSHELLAHQGVTARITAQPSYRPLPRGRGELAQWRPRRESWTVPRGTEAEGVLQGCTSAISVARGAELGFRLSSNHAAQFAIIRIFRLGAHGSLGGQEVHRSPVLHVPSTGIWLRDRRTRVDAGAWHELYRLRIEDGWRSGCYLARFETPDEKAFLHPFWVTDRAPCSRLVLVSSVLTHLAHNEWGSTSIDDLARRLPLPAASRLRSLPLLRPYAGSRGGAVLQHEFPLSRWLDANEVAIDHLTDLDVHQAPELLQPYEHVVVAGDASYLTRPLLEAFQRHEAKGSKLSVLGAAPGTFEVAVDAAAATMSVCAHSAAEEAEWRDANDRVWKATRSWRKSGKPSDLWLRPGALTADPMEGKPTHSTRVVGLCGGRLSGSSLRDDDPALLARSAEGTTEVARFCDTLLVETPNGGRVFVAGTDRWAWALDDFLKHDDVPVSSLVQGLTARVLGLSPTRMAGRRLVSVVMTAYNSEAYISKAIDSILSQTHADLELIVVDDDSSDGTFELLLSYAHRDPRVRPFKAFENHGTYWSKNYGMTKARGEFITFQDSDDWSEPQRLAVQLEPLLRSPRVHASTVDYVRIDESGRLLLNRGRWQRRAFPSLLVRADAVLPKIGYFDSVRTSADQEYFHRLRLVLGGDCVVEIRKPLYCALARGGSLTTGQEGAVSLDVRDAPAGDRLAHLSAPRRQYVLAYEAWHRRIESGGESGLLPFPLLSRPFAAPAEIDVELGRSKNQPRRAPLVATTPLSDEVQATVAALADDVGSVWLFLDDAGAGPGAELDPRVTVVPLPSPAGEPRAAHRLRFVVEPEPGAPGASPTRQVIGVESSDDAAHPPPVAAPSQVVHAGTGRSLLDFDVVLLSDFRFPGGTSFSNAEEIRAQAQNGISTGLLQVRSPVLKRDHPINPAIQGCVDAKLAAWVPPERPARCRVLIVRHPTVLNRAPDELPAIEADQVVVVVNQEPREGATSEPYYDVAACKQVARQRFGTTGSWRPIGPLVRKAVEREYGLGALASDDWHNIINVDDWRVDRASYVSDKPIIGRHSRDAANKWPDDARQLLDAYPADGEIGVRILGGAEYARRVLGRLPAAWDVLPFGSLAARDFLAGIDFFVYFHHPKMVEAFGRTILEAMATGAPVLLPEHFRELFEDAATYAEPRDVRRLVWDLYRDRAEYERRSRHGFDFVQSRFSYQAHVRRLQRLMGTDRPRELASTAPASPPRIVPGSPAPPMAPSVAASSAPGRPIGESEELQGNSAYKLQVGLAGLPVGARARVWGTSRTTRRRLFEVSIAGGASGAGVHFFTDDAPERVLVMLSVEGASADRVQVTSIAWRRRADRPPRPSLSLCETSVTAAMATYPGRRHVLPDAIDSLVGQVDKLFVYLNNFDEVPDAIRRHPRRDRIVFVLDPASELRAAAKFHWLDKVRGFHLICDDDIVYPPDYAARMVAALERRGRSAVVGLHGVVFDTMIEDARTSRRAVFKFHEALAEDTPVHFLGTGAVGLHTDVLARMDLSLFLAYPIANDEILAVSAREAGIPMVTIARPAQWLKAHPKVQFGIFEERAMLQEEHVRASRLLASGNPWPELPLAPQKP